MRVLAVSTPRPGVDTVYQHQTLEMVVCVNAAGRLAATSALPRCRLLRERREVWSGTLRADEGQWIVHNNLGDDEPIRFLRVNTLRAGDHVRLCDPGGEEISFRVEQVVPLPRSGKLCAVRGAETAPALPPGTDCPQDVGGGS
jgi:hypothetical protein